MLDNNTIYAIIWKIVLTIKNIKKMKTLRYLISFIERFFKSFYVMEKKSYQKLKKIHGSLLGLHTVPKNVHFYGYGAVLVIIGILLLIPIIVWSVLRSI